MGKLLSTSPILSVTLCSMILSLFAWICLTHNLPVPPIMGIGPVIIKEAIYLEIMDYRERGYHFRNTVEWGSDLREMQKRYQDLENFPYIADANRFPTRGECTEVLAFNRAYRMYLVYLIVPDRDARHSTINDTDRLYAIWDKLRDAQCDYYYVTVRRRALQELREMLGENAYWNGWLPPPMPLEYFRVVD